MQTIATSPTTRRGVLIENLMTSSTSANFEELLEQSKKLDRQKDLEDGGPEPELGNLSEWIVHNWYRKDRCCEIVDSQRYLIEQLIEELDTMRKECRGYHYLGDYYHGAIDPDHIFVSGGGKLSLTASPICNQDGSLTEIEHESQFLYLPRNLQSNQKALLDPTVDDLAFVRTVCQMVLPGAELRTLGSYTLLEARGQKETYLSRFLKGVAIRLYSDLKYSQDKAKIEENFEKNQAVVLDAIRKYFPRRFLTEEELVAPNSEWDDLRNVYSAVKRILQDKNWNEELDYCWTTSGDQVN